MRFLVMWYLKFKIKHSDCIYASELEKLNLRVFFYPLGEYKAKNSIFVSSMQKLSGSQGNVKKYIRYLKKHKNIEKIEVFERIIYCLAKQKYEKKTYEVIYNPMLIYPSPAYLDKNGFERWEMMCWDRKPLQDIINIMRKSKTTQHFEVLAFIKKIMHEVYILKALPDLSPKQRRAIELAYREGYYKVPRKTNLDRLAKTVGVSKSTFQETLRRAESNILPYLVSE